MTRWPCSQMVFGLEEELEARSQNATLGQMDATFNRRFTSEEIRSGSNDTQASLPSQDTKVWSTVAAGMQASRRMPPSQKRGREEFGEMMTSTGGMATSAVTTNARWMERSVKVSHVRSLPLPRSQRRFFGRATRALMHTVQLIGKS